MTTVEPESTCAVEKEAALKTRERKTWHENASMAMYAHVETKAAAKRRQLDQKMQQDVGKLFSSRSTKYGSELENPHFGELGRREWIGGNLSLIHI